MPRRAQREDETPGEYIAYLRTRSYRLAAAFRMIFEAEAPARRSFVQVFLGADAAPTRAGSAALADLRDFCGADASGFATDPLIMARNAGRREVWQRIINYLNLDEGQVQTLTEIDDGW